MSSTTTTLLGLGAGNNHHHESIDRNESQDEHGRGYGNYPNYLKCGHNNSIGGGGGHNRSASWPAVRYNNVQESESTTKKTRPTSPVEGLGRLIVNQAFLSFKWATRKFFVRSSSRQELTTNRPSAYLVYTALSALPFLLFLLIYANFNKVRLLFGIDHEHVFVFSIGRLEEVIFTIQPHKLISSFHNPVLDVLAAVPYLIHYSWPAIYPIYAFLSNRCENAGRFLQLLALVMWIHMVVWIAIPTAPPWFVDSLDVNIDLKTSLINAKPSEGAAFARVDKIFNFKLFHNMYSGNPCIFGSFPSGHVAWPFAVFLIGAPGGNYFILYIIWILWASMYSIHHYLLDGLAAMVIVGISYKLLGFCRSWKNNNDREIVGKPSPKSLYNCPLHIV